MIMQYLQHREEESFEPASRSTLCRILEVREASQQKSLSGLDNIAAKGVESFERLLSILEELNQAGANKRRVTELEKKLNDGKRYLKTEFKVNYSAEESECAHHCRKFALSDPVDPCFNHQCSRSHNMVCEQCKQLKATLDEMEESIKKHSSHLYSQEQKHDLLFVYSHMTDNELFPVLQSAYTKGHSTETALLRVVNDILSNMNKQHVSILVLLDLSAAFDTVDHAILLRRLKTSFGITDAALAWFSSIWMKPVRVGEWRDIGLLSLAIWCSSRFVSRAPSLQCLCQQAVCGHQAVPAQRTCVR